MAGVDSQTILTSQHGKQMLLQLTKVIPALIYHHSICGITLVAVTLIFLLWEVCRGRDFVSIAFSCSNAYDSFILKMVMHSSCDVSVVLIMYLCITL